MFPINPQDIASAKQRLNALAPVAWLVDQRSRSKRVTTSCNSFEPNDHRFNVKQITFIRRVNPHYTPGLPVFLNAFRRAYFGPRVRYHQST
jgi:hypothetical protein